MVIKFEDNVFGEDFSQKTIFNNFQEIMLSCDYPIEGQ